jgi:hypothetical protein
MHPEEYLKLDIHFKEQFIYFYLVKKVVSTIYRTCFNNNEANYT